MLEFPVYTQVLSPYHRVHQRVSNLVHLLRAIGVTPVFYFDCGTGSADKLQERLSRRDADVASMIELEDHLTGASAVAASNIPEDIYNTPVRSLVSQPLNKWQLISTLKGLQAEVVNCIGEADFQLAHDAQQPDVLGVMASDSDFFVTRGVTLFHLDALIVRYTESKPVHVPTGVPLHLNAAAEHSTVTRVRSHPLRRWIVDDHAQRLSLEHTPQLELWSYLYTADHTAALLALPVERLSELAFLAGNDFSKHLVQRYSLQHLLSIQPSAVPPPVDYGNPAYGSRTLLLDQ